jgi:hypothetical protein
MGRPAFCRPEDPMRTLLLAFLALACALPSPAKDKKKDKDKQELPDFVLKADSVYVTVDPDAGSSVTNPIEQDQARRAVETALLKWGRFHVLPALSSTNGDYLIIEVRKGGGARSTVSGGPLGGRLPGVDVWEGGGRVDTSSPTVGGPPRPTAEYSSMPDSFTVYIPVGNSQTRVWRYVEKGCLDRPTVHAVQEFKKALTQSEEAKLHKQP